MVKETSPWDEPVEGGILLDETTCTLKRFLVLPSGAAEIMALWILHTHCFDAFFHTPYFCINSPTKGCGKTTALDMLGQLSCKSVPASNISTAAVFRTVDEFQPTLLIDEADTFLGFRDELRGVLNCGNRKNTAYVIRLEKVGDDFQPRKFSTCCPKAFALIGRLPSTLEDRSIVVTMHRKANQDEVEEFDGTEAPDLKKLQRKAARWVGDNLLAIKDAAPQMPKELINRDRDKFKPLFALAEVIGGAWPERLQKAVLSLYDREGQEEKELGVQLLADIRELFRNFDRDLVGIASWELALLLVSDMPEDRPWSTFDKGNEITQKQLAALLAPFEIRPDQLWIKVQEIGQKVRGYRFNDFKDPFQRYLPSFHPVEAVEPCDGKGLSAVADPAGDSNATVSENDGNPHEQGILPDLPSEQGVDSDA